MTANESKPGGGQESSERQRYGLETGHVTVTGEGHVADYGGLDVGGGASWEGGEAVEVVDLGVHLPPLRYCFTMDPDTARAVADQLVMAADAAEEDAAEWEAMDQ